MKTQSAWRRKQNRLALFALLAFLVSGCMAPPSETSAPAAEPPSSEPPAVEPTAEMVEVERKAPLFPDVIADSDGEEADEGWGSSDDIWGDDETWGAESADSAPASNSADESWGDETWGVDETFGTDEDVEAAYAEEAENPTPPDTEENTTTVTVITNGQGLAKRPVPKVVFPPLVIAEDDGNRSRFGSGMGTSGSGQGGGGIGQLPSGGFGQIGSGKGASYGSGRGSGAKGSGKSLVGGTARWEVAPFTEEADWLSDFPELQASSKNYGEVLTQMVKRLLRLRMVNATASGEKLTPERLTQLVDEGVKYLCDGKLKKLLAIEDGTRLELQLVYRLRRVVGDEKFRLVHIRPLSTVKDIAGSTLSTATNRVLLAAAQQVVDSVLRDMPADMNAIRG